MISRFHATLGVAVGYAALLILVVVIPSIDLSVSRIFYVPPAGFPASNNSFCEIIHILASKGSWVFGACLLGALAWSVFKKSTLLSLTPKAWAFLFLALVLGPGLVANVLLKDHWGRERPSQITEFGGTQPFSDALSPQPVRHSNGSFVAGDPAFGFYLASFAYVVPHRRRRVFWTGLLIGTLLGFMRIAMGAHFLSDVLFAAFSVTLVSTLLYGALFGRAAMLQFWCALLKKDDHPEYG